MQKKPVETVSANERVSAAVATLLIQNNKILLGRRFSDNNIESTFEGWQCPGGYLLEGETIEQSAKRICKQKAGIIIGGLRAGPYSNNLFSESLHTVSLYVIADSYQIVDSRQFNSSLFKWSWFTISRLPAPLYLPLKNVFNGRENIYITDSDSG